MVNHSKPMISPVDVILISDTETSRVIPDLFVIYDKKGLDDKNYEGMPTMVIEVVSPGTASRDFVTKLNLYMRFGVKEYWIVSSQKRNVQMFKMQENGEYGGPMVFNEEDKLNSGIFSDLQFSRIITPPLCTKGFVKSKTPLCTFTKNPKNYYGYHLTLR